MAGADGPARTGLGCAQGSSGAAAERKGVIVVEVAKARELL